MNLRHHWLGLLVCCCAVAGCAPDMGSDRYGIRHFAGRWSPVSLTRLDYLNGTLDGTATSTPDGYFHLEVDQVRDDNALYVAVELMERLDMLRPQRDAGAFASVSGGEEGAFFWDWNIDATEFSIIGEVPLSDARTLSLMEISGRDKEGMTLTYTGLLSDSTYFEEVLVLSRQ
jgi:hypothetical protein